MENNLNTSERLRNAEYLNGRTSQILKFLPHTHENLSLIPRIHIFLKKKKKQQHTFIIPDAERQRQVDPWGSLIGQTGQRVTLSKNEVVT